MYIQDKAVHLLLVCLRLSLCVTSCFDGYCGWSRLLLVSVACLTVTDSVPGPLQ